MQLNINSDICPSCGMPKKDSTGKDMTGRPLCFYCFFRGRHSTTKMFILYVLDEIDKPLTKKELVEVMNKHPINNGRKVYSTNTVQATLRKMTNEKNRLLLTGKKMIKGRHGRPQSTFKIGNRKGRPYLKRYLKKWDTGHFVELKPSPFRQRYRKKPENKYKHSAIAKKLKNGEYERFAFIFPEGLKNLNYHTCGLPEDSETVS